MTWGQIRNRIVERMSEYTAGAAELAANATMSEATIYARMTDHFREWLDEVATRDPQKCTTLATMTYSSGAESVTLPDIVKTRPVFTVEQVISSSPNAFLPLQQVTLDQAQQGMMQWAYPRGLYPGTNYSGQYGYRIEGNLIYLLPYPTGDIQLRLRYLAAVADLSKDTDPANSPPFIPNEYHNTFALCVALSFLREVTSSPNLEREYATGWEKFTRWAASSPKTGPRRVHCYR